jgi:phenylacetate-CoA ligase
MLFSLFTYYLSLSYWSVASVDSVKKMQVLKFRKLFEHARKNSRFYREFYGDHGVLDATIDSFADIARIPITNKSILKQYSTRDIMTCDGKNGITIHSTSGSTGEPFKIAFNKYEDYTAHVRVFWALRKAGYKLTDKIVIVSRYDQADRFEIEKDLPTLAKMQAKLNLFQREIISIYEPVDQIIAKLLKTKANVLWSTPSIMQIVAAELAAKKIRLDFPIVFLTSEVISSRQKELFISTLGKHVVSLYGAMESPSLGFDFGLTEQFTVFPNSNYFEFETANNNRGSVKLGKVIITNLINTTMPVIRYDLNDLAEIDEHPDFGFKYIKKIVGRQDDIVKLANGKYLAHHHAYEMFKDFHECEIYKFVQKPDKTVLLQLKIARDQDRSHVEKLAHERWEKRFAGFPLAIEFVEQFEVNAQTGKFRNIEIQ